MLMVFTGNGKGKTTSALGQALRAVGEGKKVLMVQFIKGPWASGEDESVKRLEPEFKIVKMGRGFVGILNDNLPRAIHEQAACEALAYASSEAKSKKWDMLILDEMNVAVSLNLISAANVLKMIDEAQACVEHIILTGRGAPAAFLEKADLITEMNEVKHPYQKKSPAVRGIEY